MICVGEGFLGIPADHHPSPLLLHIRTVRIAIGIVETATGEERGMVSVTTGTDATEMSTGLLVPVDETGTMIPKGVLEGPLLHR